MNNNSSQKNGILVTMPKLFIIFSLLVIIFPLLGMMFGFKLGVVNWAYEAKFIYHALYYWSLSILAILITLLAFTHYSTTCDFVAFSIAISFFYAAYFNTVFTLSNEWSNPLSKDVENMHAYVWLLSNILTGLLLIVGLKLFSKQFTQKKILFVLLIGCIIYSSYWFISYLPSLERMTRIIYPEKIMTHPLGLINLSLYLYFIVALYPKLIKEKSTILTRSLLYNALLQCIMSCYMIFGTLQLYDTAYIAAALAQLLSYAVIFGAFILNFITSYDFALASQQELRQQKEKFEHLSTYDPLTQLLNRYAFERISEKIIENAKHDDQKFTFLYLDLDNLKSVNDVIGHDIGDLLIKQVAKRLQHTIRKSDFCARLGGDEFGIILTDIHVPSAINRIAQKLIDVLNQPFNINGKLLYSGGSIGIAIFPKAGDTYQKLLKNADTAMYQAKTSGKNTYVFFTKNLSKTYFRELEIENYLRDALQNDEFYLQYQPIYNLATKELIAGEVLLRWENKHLGIIMPQEFISIAERSGLIIPLGNWIIEKVCEQINVWGKKYQKILQFSVNLSPIQLSNSSFILAIKNTLVKNNIKGNRLILELTETALLEHRLKIEENIITLAKLGISLSLDDFGTGYSSLSRLKSLPISSLKIDKSFILDLENNNDSAIIVETIIQLAQHLQKKVIAEGIETDSQLKFLTERGCHCGQGFLFSNSLSALEFEALAYTNN